MKRHLIQLVMRGMILALSAMACASAFAQTYTVREIPPLQSQIESGAMAINRKGAVAGYSINAAKTQVRGIYCPPPYSSSVSIGVYGSRTQSYALSVNNAGLVCGYSNGGNSNDQVPVVWWSNFLGTTAVPQGASASKNTDINNQGVVVTETSASSLSNSDGTITDLPSPQNFDFPIVSAINDSGVAVGSALSLSLGKIRAVRWTGGVPAELQVLSAGRSLAFDIANNGAIVGVSATEGGLDRAFMLTPENVPLNLGILSGDTTSEAHSTNGTDAVGLSHSAANGYRAVLFQGGEAKNLNDLIPADSGWVLQKAFGINDYGQICGEGTLDGTPKGFLLTLINPIGGAVDWDFTLGDNDWTAATNIPPFEPAEAAHVPGTGYGIRATSFPSFGFLQSPLVPLQTNRRYRVWCTIRTTATSANTAPQFRLRAIEATTNVSALLSLDSTDNIMPAPGNSKTFQYSLTTIAGNLNQSYRFNLDYTFFDPFDEGDAWVYLERLILAEE